MAITEILAPAGMNPVSLPGSASVPTEDVAVDPIAQRIFAVFELSDSKIKPIALAGAVNVDADVVIEALLEIVPCVPYPC